ncbi:MAG: YjgN family protein [Sphingomonadaceae bacterium]
MTGETMALPQGERVVQPQFTASAGEYFRIWIVNLLFSLLTLGIYSAWAKVRKRRYFYGSTRLDGATFDYFASPKAVLKGRILAAGIVAIYALATELYPNSRFGFWAAGLILLPWLGVRAYAFNARNSGWRGVRFDFVAGTAKAARTYAAMVAIVIVTLGLAFPWFMARMKSFVVSNHAFGTARLECRLRGRDFFRIYFLAGLIVAVMGAPLAFGASWLVMRQQYPEAITRVMLLLPAVPVYAAYIVGYAYSESRTTNLLWNNTHGPGVRFASTLSALRMTRLYLGNVLAVLFTAGLLMPWAVIRTRRYRLSCLSMIVQGEPVFEANASLPRVGAMGQELGDFFNVDLGI